MENTLPEFHEYLTALEDGTWIDARNGSIYGADGFEIIAIHSDVSHYFIPEGVRSINLISCDGFASVTFPSSLIEIKDITKLNCSEVVNNSPHFVVEQGGLYTADKRELIRAFEDMTSEDEDFIIEGTTEIRSDALSGFSKFDVISLPSSVKEIGSYAFCCADGIQSIILPKGVEIIREGTFAFCDDLRRVDLPDSITTIEDEAFQFCEMLEAVTLPKNLLSISEEAFRGCNNIKHVVVESPHFTLQNGILYNSDMSKIIHEFTGIMNDEITIPTSLRHIPMHSSILNLDKTISVSKHSPSLTRLIEAHGIFLNITD